MHELHRLSGDQMEAVLTFELENRACFARSINDRGDEFYETFSAHHDARLPEQDAGVCAFYVLAERDGSIVGRFNLYDLGARDRGSVSSTSSCPTIQSATEPPTSG